MLTAYSIFVYGFTSVYCKTKKTIYCGLHCKAEIKYYGARITFFKSPSNLFASPPRPKVYTAPLAKDSKTMQLCIQKQCLLFVSFHCTCLLLKFVVSLVAGWVPVFGILDTVGTMSEMGTVGMVGRRYDQARRVDFLLIIRSSILRG
jgi:hypothetical protein